MGFWKEWWGELGRRNRAPAWPVGAPVTTWSGARPTASPLLIQGCQGTWRVEDPAPKPAVTTKLPSSMRGSGFCLCQLKCTHFYSYLNLASTGLNSPWSKRRNRSQGSCQKPRNSPGTLPWSFHHGTKASVPLSPSLELWSLQDAVCQTLLSFLFRRTRQHQ